MRIRVLATRVVLLLTILWVSLAPFSAKPAEAAGEIYTWKDYQTITVTGGATKTGGPANDNTLHGGAIILPGSPVTFFGTLLINSNKDPRGCELTIQLFLPSGQGQGTINATWNPSAGAPGSIHACSMAEVSQNDKDGFNNQAVNIQGTRPGQNDTPERPDQQAINVTAYYGSNQAPSNVTFSIEGNGVTEQAIEPGGSLPVGPGTQYKHTFVRDPGHYKVCVGPPINACAELDKQKYVPYTVPSFGETGDERMINTVVEINFINFPNTTIGPLDIGLHKPNGDNLGNTVSTESVTTPDTGNSDNDVNFEHHITLHASTPNVDQGDYKVCVEGIENLSACADVHKTFSDAANTTIKLSADQVATLIQSFTSIKDPNVCDTGTGFGGVAGFFLCPLMRVVVDATDFIQTNFIIPYLTVSPLTTNNDPKTGQPPIAYTLWKSFRDLANVALVIAFFVVIFSQATSIGVSNYGIKKILPRLAIVAIGANLSYFIVGFIIDAFNIFGAGVANLVMGVVNAGSTSTQPVSVAQEAFWTIATPALVAVAIKAGVFLKALAAIVAPLFMMILISMVVLIIRQMLILILVVLSPLAIVAYLLPNTQRYYKDWQKLLLELLIMYPLLVLLFASGKIIGAILAGNVNLANG